MEEISLTIPMPLQVVVDDVGWWSGTDGSRFNQPFRSGMGRDHLPADYEALARLGKGLGIKILAGFVLCEWDIGSILKNLPSATWMGEEWCVDWVNREHMERAACIIKQAGQYMEIALHGIGHEFWSGGTMHRAEFHDDRCRMRGQDEIRRHLDFFLKLMDQHGFSPMPTAFIPPAMKHSFGDGDRGVQKLLNEAGIKRVTACFQKARQFIPPVFPTFTWESGVVLLDRAADLPWNSIACKPEFGFESPLVVLHWPNILHQHPEQNFSIVDRWVDFIKQGARRHNCILSMDMETCFTQYIYRICSKISQSHNEFHIDLSWRKRLPLNALNCSFAVRINSQKPLAMEITGAGVDSLSRDFETSLVHLVPEGDHIYLKFG